MKLSGTQTGSKVGRLHPTVKATGFVSFFTDMGSEMIYPILPMFLTQQLGASRAMLGWIEGLAEGFPSILKLFSGALSDKVKNRKWLILIGYGLSTIFKPLIALAGSAPVALALRLIDRFGKGIRGAPRDALVADFTGASSRGYAFGYQRAMDHAGALMGGLIAFLMLSVLGLSMKQTIAWSWIPGILAVVVILFFLRDKKEREIQPHTTVNPFKGLRTLPAAYYLYIAGASMFAMANSSDAFLLLRARDMGVALIWIPLLWSALHLVKTVTSVLGGHLSDRIGRMPLLLAGWSLYALVYFGFALLGGPLNAWLLFLLYGLFFGLTEGAARAVIADIIPEGTRGTAFGFWGTIEGFLTLAASVVTGWLWDKTGGSRVPLMICGILSFTAAIYMLGFNSFYLRKKAD